MKFKKILLFVVAVFIFSILHSINAFSLDYTYCNYYNPLAYWPLTANYSDCTEGQNHNLTNSGTVLNASGAFFDANDPDYLYYNDNSNFTSFNTSDFTICFNASIDARNDGHIASHWNNQYDKGWRIQIFNSTSAMALHIQTTQIRSPVTETERWDYWCLRRNNSKMYMFKNGTLINETSISVSANPDVARPFEIGRFNGPGLDYFDGGINHFGIWTSALSDNSVYTLFSGANYTLPEYDLGYNVSIIERDPLLFTFDIQNKTNYSEANTTATLVFNNTRYNPDNRFGLYFTRTIYAPGLDVLNESNITFYWEYNLTNQDTGAIQYLNTTFQNISVNRMVIDNCGALTGTRTFNFTVMDEENITLLPDSDVDIGFTVWSLNSSYTKYYSWNYSAILSEEYCIYPSYANLTSNIFADYEKSGYNAREWIREGYRLDNQTNFEYFYLLSGTDETEITIHVSDDNDDDYADVLVEAYRYVVANNSYILIETETTNTEGEAKIFLDTEYYYMFKFYYDTELKLETNRFKITTTDLYYRISEGVDTPLSKWLRSRTITGDLSYTKSTHTIILQYNDPQDYASHICLNITMSNSSYQVFGECTTLNSGNLSHTLVDLNVSYTAFAYAILNEGDTYQLDTLGIKEDEFWETAGEDSFAIAFLMLAVSGLIGTVSVVVGVILLLVSVVVITQFELIHIVPDVLVYIIAVGVLIIILRVRRRR